MNDPAHETYAHDHNDIFGQHNGDPEQDLLLMEEQVREIKRLRAHVGSLQVQIADYRQIVKELSDKLALLEKNI